MALKYTIVTVEPIPSYDAGVLASYTDRIQDIDSYEFMPANEGFEFVIGPGTGFIQRERVRFILPYDDGS